MADERVERKLAAILAADVVGYWYATIDRMWPPAYVQGNTWNLIETYRRLRALLDDDIDRIVPGHDPELFERHSSWVAGHHTVAEIHLAAGDTTRRKD